MASSSRVSNYKEVSRLSDSDGGSTPDLELEHEETVPGEQAETPRHRPGSLLKRLAVVGSIATVVFIGAFAILKFKHSRIGRREYIRGSHPGFVNYVASPVHRSLLGAAELCAPEIVSTTCTILNQETTEFWHDRADDSLTEVHAMELSQALSISPESIRQFFISLGLEDTDTEYSESFAVTCQELCERTVGAFEPHQLPAASDVACVKTPWQQPNCSLNVHPNALREITFPGGNKSMGKKFQENKAMKAADPADKQDLEEQAAADRAATSVMYSDQPIDVVRNAVARQFRMFPHIEAVYSDSGDLGYELFGPAQPKVQQRRLSNANWQAITSAAAAKGQAYINQALMHMNSRKIPDVVFKWFGKNDDAVTRARVKEVLNGISRLLDNVQYVYPGDECDPSTYAYVYPMAPWNKNRNAGPDHGKYIFYLCDYYMSVDEGERIETLTHEGSHHEPMRTTDNEAYYFGFLQVMYGRPICEDVANQCKGGNTDVCALTRNNADSLSYFINDAALAHMNPQPTVTPTPVAREVGQGGGGLFGSLFR